MVRYTSVWDMRSKKIEKAGNRSGLVLLYSFVLMLCLFLSSPCSQAEIVDRVVAYVDDEPITLSEFKETRAAMRETVPTIKDLDVINSMVNSILLYKEGLRMRLEAPSKDDIIREYIEIRVKSPIVVREEDIEKFYREHTMEFKGKVYIAVRDEIERYLFELETNRQLKKHIDELKANAEVIIQLTEQ